MAATACLWLVDDEGRRTADRLPFLDERGELDVEQALDVNDRSQSELGFKATLFDGRVRFNGAAFSTDYDDLQVQVFNSVAPVTQNIGKAKPAVPVQVFDSAEEAEANRAALEAKWNPKPKAA